MIERFMDKVSPEPMSGCWLWTASVDRHGYGTFAVNHQHKDTAHRVSWALHNGPIPAGKQVLHRCDVRPCVNPGHLFLGTHRDNIRDAANKGRLSPQTNPERYCRPATICSACGGPALPFARKRGRCNACYQFWRRTGKDRPYGN